MNLRFHHIGVACEDIENTLKFIDNTFNIIHKTEIIQHDNHGVKACLVTNNDGTNIELVSGVTVERFVKKKQFLYHNCWEVENINTSINKFVENGAMLISEPKSSELFDNRRVAFLLTDIGILELLEKRIIHD